MLINLVLSREYEAQESHESRCSNILFFDCLQRLEQPSFFALFRQRYLKMLYLLPLFTDSLQVKRYFNLLLPESLSVLDSLGSFNLCLLKLALSMLHPVLGVFAVKRKLALLLACLHFDFQNVLSHGQDLSPELLDLHLRIGIVLLSVSVAVLLLLFPELIHILEVFSSQLKFLLQTVYLFAKFLGDAVCLV